MGFSGTRLGTARSWLRHGGVLALVGLLAACGSSAPERPRATRAPAAPSIAGEACLQDLTARGVIFKALPQTVSSGGCTLVNGVTLEGMSAALNRPVSLTCPTARMVDRWMDEVVQPAARRHLRTRVTVVHQAGGYVCRSSRNGRLSEHARGRAIDIWGFVLADGSKAIIRDHWRGAGARSRFLQEVGQKSCGLFHVVLGPGADADHHDHFHLDLGEWKLCQV